MATISFDGRLRDWYLQLFGLFVKQPSLRLTDTARSELMKMMARSRDYESVATLLWASPSVDGKPIGESRWVVAFYDRFTRPSGRVTNVDGIPFVFVQADAFRLNEATLDFYGDRFIVIDDRF